MTSNDRKRVNSHREEPSESVYDSKEQIRRDGIEDWIAYLDGLDSKIEIESMDPHTGDIKVMIYIENVFQFFLGNFRKFSPILSRIRNSYLLS